MTWTIYLHTPDCIFVVCYSATCLPDVQIVTQYHFVICVPYFVRKYMCTVSCGDCGSTVVKVLCYKSEGRWFDPRWCQWTFH